MEGECQTVDYKVSLTSDFHSTVMMKDLEKLTLFIVFFCLFLANLHSKYEWRDVERTSVTTTVQKGKIHFMKSEKPDEAINKRSTRFYLHNNITKYCVCIFTNTQVAWKNFFSLKSKPDFNLRELFSLGCQRFVCC